MQETKEHLLEILKLTIEENLKTLQIKEILSEQKASFNN